jgi:D-glycero-alpha-D-manno-heptose-7-phosphate kinase
MTRYPHASVSQIQLPNSIWWELERRLVLIYLGKSHSSSEVHEMVIQSQENAGSENTRLQELRTTAPISRDALYAGDFLTLGKTMSRNTEAQRRLHPKLISADAQQVIDITKTYNAIGWKVNGAGGEGGSLTILCGAQSEEKRAMIQAIEAENSLIKHIPTYLSRFGLRVWKQDIGRNHQA